MMGKNTILFLLVMNISSALGRKTGNNQAIQE